MKSIHEDVQRFFGGLGEAQDGEATMKRYGSALYGEVVKAHSRVFKRWMDNFKQGVAEHGDRNWALAFEEITKAMDWINRRYKFLQKEYGRKVIYPKGGVSKMIGEMNSWLENNRKDYQKYVRTH